MSRTKCLVVANDKSIGSYLLAARAVGIEEVDWVYEWKDGGRVAFIFTSDELKQRFYTFCLLVFD